VWITSLFIYCYFYCHTFYHLETIRKNKCSSIDGQNSKGYKESTKLRLVLLTKIRDECSFQIEGKPMSKNNSFLFIFFFSLLQT
jgi:hypothetical protein